MYKPGEVRNRLKIDTKTLLSWVDRFQEFFSDGAKGLVPGTLQRTYSEEDLIVVNTILKLRGERKDFEPIRESLAAGYRDRDLPPAFYGMDGEKAVVVYNHVKEIEAKYEAAQGEIGRLRTELEKQAEESERLRSEERERLQNEIRRLDRENAVLKYQLDQLMADDDE
jgi:DNA-binding transcriptional MerR regulator